MPWRINILINQSLSLSYVTDQYIEIKQPHPDGHHHHHHHYYHHHHRCLRHYYCYCYY